MMSYQIDSDFEPHFKKTVLWKFCFPLKNSMSIIGHITRFINKFSENLFLEDNFKIIKCLEEQLYQILEKLSNMVDA